MKFRKKRRLTKRPFILESPVQSNDSRMSIELFQRIPFDEYILRLLLSLDMILVEYFERIRPIRWVNRSNEGDLKEHA